MRASPATLVRADVGSKVVTVDRPGTSSLNENEPATTRDHRGVPWEVLVSLFAEVSGDRVTVWPSITPIDAMASSPVGPGPRNGANAPVRRNCPGLGFP